MITIELRVNIMYEHKANKDKRDLITKMNGLKSSFPDMNICSSTVGAVLERSTAYGVVTAWNSGDSADLSELTISEA